MMRIVLRIRICMIVWSYHSNDMEMTLWCEEANIESYVEDELQLLINVENDVRCPCVCIFPYSGASSCAQWKMLLLCPYQSSSLFEPSSSVEAESAAIELWLPIEFAFFHFIAVFQLLREAISALRRKSFLVFGKCVSSLWEILDCRESFASLWKK